MTRAAPKTSTPRNLEASPKKSERRRSLSSEHGRAAWPESRGWGSWGQQPVCSRDVGIDVVVFSALRRKRRCRVLAHEHSTRSKRDSFSCWVVPQWARCEVDYWSSEHNRLHSMHKRLKLGGHRLLHNTLIVLGTRIEVDDERAPGTQRA